MQVWLSVRSRVPLKEVSRGRDNNLNLIRFIAASMVLVSHSFALYTGSPAAEPWRTTLGISMGGMAVDVFFCASGYLVVGSLLASQSTRDFLIARALRIYPGLWVALLLSVLAIGFFATSVTGGVFFSSFETWKYLVKNSVMVMGGEFQLPGAFAGNPFKGAVNGSLWTLPLELRAYLILMAIWLAVKYLRYVPQITFARACVVGAAITAAWAITSILVGQTSKFATLLSVFLFGAAFRLYSHRVVLSVWGLVAGILLLTFSVWIHVKLFLVTYLIALPYLLLCLVFLPQGAIRKYNQVGDYSYGVYIYAFPIQQFLMMGWIASLTGLICASFVLTLVMAALSWHAIEKPALALRERVREN